jgi:hypothetical protein
MSLLLWASIIGGVLIVVAVFVHWLDRMQHRAHYVDTPAWQREHWQEQHERAKFAQRRSPSGL